MLKRVRIRLLNMNTRAVEVSLVLKFNNFSFTPQKSSAIFLSEKARKEVAAAASAMEVLEVF